MSNYHYNYDYSKNVINWNQLQLQITITTSLVYTVVIVDTHQEAMVYIIYAKNIDRPNSHL